MFVAMSVVMGFMTFLMVGVRIRVTMKTVAVIAMMAFVIVRL